MYSKFAFRSLPVYNGDLSSDYLCYLSDRTDIRKFAKLHEWRGKDLSVSSLSLYGGPDRFFLEAPGIGQFSICERAIGVSGCSSCETNQLEHFILNQLLPLLLVHNGKHVIHAASVLLSGGCAVFVGESGVGKSTLSAGFLAAGEELLGDDGLIVTNECGRYCARATYLSLRLREKAFRYFSDVAHFPFFFNKHTVSRSVNIGRYWSIAAIFLLSPPRADLKTVSLKRVTPREATMRLLKSAFQLDVPSTQSAQRAFSHAANLAETVPCYDLAYRRDFDLLAQVMGLIKDCVSSLMKDRGIVNSGGKL